MNQIFITSKAPASGLEPEHQKNLITQRLAISCLTKLGLYRHIVGGEGLEPPVPKPRIYSPLQYQFCSSTYKRRTQDLHLQVISDQRSSRPLPHCPDIRRILYKCDQWESNPYLQIHNLRY